MRAFSIPTFLSVLLLLSGCTDGCGASPVRAEWEQAGTYAAAKAQGLPRVDVLPGLPLSDPDLAARWDNASLRSVAWKPDPQLGTGFPPIQLKRGNEVEVVVWKDLDPQTRRALLTPFLTNVTADGAAAAHAFLDAMSLQPTGRFASDGSGNRRELLSGNATWNGTLRLQELYEELDPTSAREMPGLLEAGKWRFEFDVPRIEVKRSTANGQYTFLVHPNDRASIELHDSTLRKDPEMARNRIRDVVVGLGLPPPPRAEVFWPRC